MNDITLTFGKHSGKKLSEVPSDYLAWLTEQDIRKQPEAAQAAKAFLAEHPITPTTKRTQEPGHAPQTYQEASKFGWMAGKRYGNAKATMLAVRDQDGFLCVRDDEDTDDYVYWRLLEVLDNGEIMDAHFQTSDQAKKVLARYPHIDSTPYLLEAQEWEEMEADHERRSLTFTSRDGRHTIRLTVWTREDIEVSIDGRDACHYLYRLSNDTERHDPKWKAAAGVLEHEYASEGADNIGLTAERNILVLQKIEEVACITKP